MSGGVQDPYDYLFKFLVIGAAGTGKSCLLHQFIESQYKEDSSHTIGVEFGSKIVPVGGRTVKLQIWDTAGQERFRTITTAYYRGAMGIMLVYDITNAKSFDNIAKWLRNIDEHANEDVERMILGNKCDMDDKRVVTKERGEEIAREHNIKFLETSAKVGNIVARVQIPRKASNRLVFVIIRTECIF